MEEPDVGVRIGGVCDDPDGVLETLCHHSPRVAARVDLYQITHRRRVLAVAAVLGHAEVGGGERAAEAGDRQRRGGEGGAAQHLACLP